MVDQKKLHHTLTALLDKGRLGAYRQPFRNINGAGDSGTRAPCNDRMAIGTDFRFPIRPQFGRAHFDQTHAAVAGRTECGMVTVVRDETAALHTSLDQAGSRGKLFPLPVNLDIDHRDRRSSALGLGFGGGCGSAHRWIIRLVSL